MPISVAGMRLSAGAARIRTQELLADLARQPDMTVTSAHDPAELHSLSDR